MNPDSPSGGAATATDSIDGMKEADAAAPALRGTDGIGRLQEMIRKAVF